MGVVGLGLIGGSIARRAVAGGARVLAWNPTPEVMDAAAAHGVEPAESIADLCAAAPDVLVLATPLRAMAQVVAEVAPRLDAGTVLTDVGSVKGPISALVAAAGASSQFVGAHPMAGTERTGYGAADPGMLDAARWAVAIEPTTQREHLVRVVAMITGLLGGVVLPVDPEAHDEAVALVSHLPHVAATELLNLVGRSRVRSLALNLAAGAFRDGTRVGGTNRGVPRPWLRRTRGSCLLCGCWCETWTASRTSWSGPAVRRRSSIRPPRSRTRSRGGPRPTPNRACCLSRVTGVRRSWRRACVGPS